MEIAAIIAVILYFLPGILTSLVLLGVTIWGILASIKFDYNLRKSEEKDNER